MTTNHEPPTTNHQPPTTNHQPPTTNQRDAGPELCARPRIRKARGVRPYDSFTNLSTYTPTIAPTAGARM